MPWIRLHDCLQELGRLEGNAVDSRRLPARGKRWDSRTLATKDERHRHVTKCHLLGFKSLLPLKRKLIQVGQIGSPPLTGVFLLCVCITNCITACERNEPMNARDGHELLANPRLVLATDRYPQCRSDPHRTLRRSKGCRDRRTRRKTSCSRSAEARSRRPSGPDTSSCTSLQVARSCWPGH